MESLSQECISFLFGDFIEALAHTPNNGSRVEEEKWLRVRNSLRRFTENLAQYRELVKSSMENIAPIRRITPKKKGTERESPCIETYAPKVEASLCMEALSGGSWFFHPFESIFLSEETSHFSPYERVGARIKSEFPGNAPNIYQHNVYWLVALRLEVMERYLRVIQLSIDVDREHFERIKGIPGWIETLETAMNKTEPSRVKWVRNRHIILDLREEFRNYTKGRGITDAERDLNEIISYKREICHQLSMWMQAHFPLALIIRDAATEKEELARDSLLWNVSAIDYMKAVAKNGKGKDIVKKYVRKWGNIMSSRRAIAYLLMPDDTQLFYEGTMPNMNPFWQHVDFFRSRPQMKESAPEFQIFNKAAPQRCRARSFITILIKKCKEDKHISTLMLYVMACTLMGYYKNVEYHPSLHLRMTYYRRFFVKNVSESEFLAYISYPTESVVDRDFLKCVSENQLKEFIFFSLSQFMHCSVDYLTDLKKHIECLYYWKEREEKLKQVIDTALRVIDMNAFSQFAAEYTEITGKEAKIEKSYVSAVCSLLIYAVTEGSRVIPSDYPFLKATMNDRRRINCPNKHLVSVSAYTSFRFSHLIEDTGKAFFPAWLIPSVIEKLMEEVKRCLNKNFAYRERKQPFHKLCLKACNDRMMRSYCEYVMSKKYLGLDLDEELRSPHVKNLYIRNSAVDNFVTPRKVCFMLADLRSEEEANTMRESLEMMRYIFRKHQSIPGIKEAEFLRFFGVSEETTTKLALAKNSYLYEGISTFTKNKIKEIPGREFPYVLTFFEELSRILDYRIIKLPTHIKHAQKMALKRKHNISCPVDAINRKCATFYFCPNEMEFKNIVPHTIPSEIVSVHSLAEVNVKKGLVITHKGKTSRRGRKVKRHKNITGTNNVSFDFMGNVFCAQRPITQAKMNEINKKKVLGIETSEEYISVFSHYENASWSGHRSITITREMLSLVRNSIKKAMTSEKIAEAKEKDNMETISKCEKTRVVPVSLLGNGIYLDGQLIVMCCECASPTVFEQTKCYGGLYYCVDCLTEKNDKAVEELKKMYIEFEYLPRACFYCGATRVTIKGGRYRSYRVWDDISCDPKFKEIWLCPSHVRQCGMSSLGWYKASEIKSSIRERKRGTTGKKRYFKRAARSVKVELVSKNPDLRAFVPKKGIFGGGRTT